jgi:cellulose synthase/poly-beta-1,6-N-acetylglucosamine synthase-like glycosyltransferase
MIEGLSLASGILLAIFWATSAITWLSSFGYTMILSLIVRARHPAPGSPGDEPEIAFVVPTLNEESMIRKKIEDIKRSDYPREKIRFVVVDGGSDDRTAEIVREEIFRGEKIELLCLPGIRNKAAQINHALEKLSEDIIVFSDADSEIEPSCIRELVTVLSADPKTAIVGATVRPRTRLLAERIHWWFLNDLWWLEGELFFCAGVSAVCYAIHRNALGFISRDSRADDIHFGLAAGARGFRARLSRRALAAETRVPQTVKEFVRYRRRRGSCYAYEVFRVPRRAASPFRSRLLRFIRLWQFLATPMMAAAAIFSGLLLLATRHWPVVPLAVAAFLVPATLRVFVLAGQDGEPRRWVLGLETIRYMVLFLASLFIMKIPFPGQGALGGNRNDRKTNPDGLTIPEALDPSSPSL